MWSWRVASPFAPIDFTVRPPDVTKPRRQSSNHQTSFWVFEPKIKQEAHILYRPPPPVWGLFLSTLSDWCDICAEVFSCGPTCMHVYFSIVWLRRRCFILRCRIGIALVPWLPGLLGICRTVPLILNKSYYLLHYHRPQKIVIVSINCSSQKSLYSLYLRLQWPSYQPALKHICSFCKSNCSA